MRWIGVAIIGVGLIFSGCAQSNKEAENRPIHHLADGGFKNLPGAPAREAGFFDMVVFFADMYFDSEKVLNPSDHVLPEDAVQFAAATAPIPSVTWLGHAAFIVRTGGKIVLTDPFLGENAGPAGFGPKRHAAPAMTVADLPDIDVILISHNHYDHLDFPTLNALPGKDRVQVVVPLGVGAIFREMGYSNIHELDWWQSRTFDRLNVTLLPANHFSGRGLFDRNDTLWGSFAMYSDDARLWFSGDTAYGPVFKEIGIGAGPFDVALVAIGAFEPQKIMRSSHVTPEEAVTVLSDIGAKRGIGMHWGTIKLTQEDPFATAARFKAAARDQGYGEANAITLKIGETFALGANATH